MFLLLQFGNSGSKVWVCSFGKVEFEIHGVVVDWDCCGCTVGIGRFLGRIRPTQSMAARWLDGWLGPVSSAPSGAAGTLEGRLPVCSVDLGAGLVDGVSRTGVRGGCCVAAGK